MMHKIDSIEGIGPAFKAKLNGAGIHTVEELRAKGADPRGLAEIVQHSGLRENTIRKWVGIADLFRVDGISTQFSELLSECDINSVAELARRNPKKLFKKVSDVNGRKKLCKTTPNVAMLKRFIEKAKALPRHDFI